MVWAGLCLDSGHWMEMSWSDDEVEPNTRCFVRIQVDVEPGQSDVSLPFYSSIIFSLSGQLKASPVGPDSLSS